MSADAIPQQPYFLRALYEWCVDSGYTPYVTVRVDAGCKVPPAHVKEGRIVLNIAPAAVRNLHMDNDWLSFSARFGGVAQLIEVPVANVLAIHARETGDGMAFVAVDDAAGQAESAAADSAGSEESPDPDRPKGRPSLKLVK